MFSFYQRNFKITTIIGHFGFVFGENLVRELGNHMISTTSSFLKSSIFKKSLHFRKAGTFKFLQFEEQPTKSTEHFQDRLVLTVGSSVEIKLRFLISLA